MSNHVLPPLAASAPRRPGVSITQKTGAVFLFLMLLGIANVLVIRGAVQEFNGVAATVNLAGSLRYLSQKIALHATNAVNGRSLLGATVPAQIQQYEEALNALENGGSALGFEINPLRERHREELENIRSDWKKYRAEVEAILRLPVDRANAEARAAELTAGAEMMLHRSEQLMQSLTGEAQRRQNFVLFVIYLLFALDVAVLVAVFLLVRARFVLPLRELARHSMQLAEGAYHTRLDYRSRDEMGMLAEAFNESAGRIGTLVARLEQERSKLVRAESMFRGVAENSVVGVYVAQDGKFQFVNAKMAEMFGYDVRTMAQSVSVLDLVPEGDRELVEANVQKRVRGDLQEVHYERRGCKSDGSLFDVEVFGSTMRLDLRPATIGIMLDITRRKQAEAKMHMAALVYENSSEGMTITDADGIVVDINPAFSRITGYSREETIGRRISILQSGRQDEAFYRAMWAALIETGQWQGEIWNRRKNGQIYAEWLTINTSYNEDGSVYRRVALFYDITQKKQADDLVWRQANFDGLTGLPNRLMFIDRLKQEIRKAHRSGMRMALLFIDLDRFKEVNDTLGHALGDLLLQQTAERLIRCVRESDTVARLGGDEFTIVLGELAEESSIEPIVQAVLSRITDPFLLGEEVAYISASVGVTFYPDDATDVENLLKNADQAMYAAKALGRNRLHYFTAKMQEAAQARRRTASDLRSALALGQFHLHYQPIVDLRTMEIKKAEALIRWRHPERGMVSPEEFIPVAEESGLIEDIGNWVFREAARQAAQWRDRCPEFQVSINTSPAQYRNRGIPHERWFDHLRTLGLAGNAVAVEITEGLLLDTSAAITDQILRFRREGLQVSLDDFGTGYSSLSYLSRLDIDYLKIDRLFVVGLGTDFPNSALCEAMITMAHKLGIQVIAEGIETEAQKALLIAAGCDFGQGFLFSEPVPADEFELFLARRGMSDQ